MSDTPLANLQILITGDYSELEQSLTDATSAASTAGGAITQALNQPGSGQQLTDSINDVSNATVQAGDQLSLFGGQVKDSAAQMDLFDTNAISASESMQQVGDGAAAAVTSLNDAGAAAEGAGEAVGESSSEWSELLEKFLAFAGVEVGVEAAADALKDFAAESIEAYSTIQNATVALTAMTGSAEKAAEQIEGLENLANSDALSFPSLLSAAQKMTAFGMSADQVTQAIGLAADAAAATGNSFDRVSNSLDRIVESGTAGARQLVQLGITQQQLAAIMGVSTTEITADFKAMDPSDRLAIISQALQKFGGDAALMTQTVTGATNQLANAWEHTFSTVGASIAPALAGLEGFATYVVSGFGVMWSDTIGKVQTQFSDLITFLATGSTEGTAAFQAEAAATKAGVDVIVAAFNVGKPAADQFFLAMSGQNAKLQDAQTSLANLSVSLQTATDLYTKGQISLAVYQTTVDAYGKALDAASTNGENFANSLLGVSTAQVKANNLLGESLSTLQQLTPGTADYGRAVQDVGSAWNAANPGGVQFANTLMGIGQETSQQNATFRSLTATFAQLEAGFSAGTVSANLFLNTASKLEAAAKAAHQPFADVAVDVLNLKDATDQAAASNDAAVGAFDAIYQQYLKGAVGLQALEAALKNAQKAATDAGTSFSNAAAQALLLNNNAALQIQAFKDDIAVLGQFNNVLTLTDSQSIAAGNAFKNLQTAGTALGITVTQVAGAQNSFELSTTGATPAVQKLVQQLAAMFTQQGLTVTATNNAAKGFDGFKTSATTAGVTVQTVGTQAATAATQISTVGNAMVQAAQAAQGLQNPLQATASALIQLNQQASNQVSAAQGIVGAWISLNSEAQTTVQGQLAVQNAFKQAQSALAAMGIQLTATGATTNSANAAVQAMTKQLNDAIQAMQATPGPAANAAAGITAVGNAAATAAGQVNSFQAGMTGLSAAGAQSAGTVLSMLAALGAPQGTISGAGQALGLMQTGNNSFETMAEWNATVGAATNTVVSFENGVDVFTHNVTAASTAVAASTPVVTTATTATAALSTAVSTATTAVSTSAATTTAATTATGLLATSGAAANDVLGTLANMGGNTTLTISGMNADMQSLTDELNAGTITLAQYNQEATALSQYMAAQQTAMVSFTGAVGTATSALGTFAGTTTTVKQNGDGTQTTTVQNPDGTTSSTTSVLPGEQVTGTGGTGETALGAVPGIIPGFTLVPGTANTYEQSAAASYTGGLSGNTNPFYGSTGWGSNVSNGSATGGLGYTGAPMGAYSPPTPSYTTGNPLPVSVQNQLPPAITISIPGATIVGSNGAQQLAQAVQQQLVVTLRQAGMKI